MTRSQTHMTVISLDVEMRQMKSSISFKLSKISKHDDSLFAESTVKLKTGLSCHND